MTDAWTWHSIIDALSGEAPGGLSDVAGALSQSISTVSGWRERGIPSGHWAAVVVLAADRGKPEITLEVLAELAARKLARKLDEARA